MLARSLCCVNCICEQITFYITCAFPNKYIFYFHCMCKYTWQNKMTQFRLSVTCRVNYNVGLHHGVRLLISCRPSHLVQLLYPGLSNNSLLTRTLKGFNWVGLFPPKKISSRDPFREVRKTQNCTE